ncbi:hypothetical protein E2562_007282 [Oryza meyeriana var. granulata]|uniref:Uncharacterized protein n=1 Tax=Oryza meyeriana var. granulata TaxID=110450 RepID=A0A6G1CE60_9ORYZ|nr:hypothetical protein E2562_007282 [Oryza meyeriana var. granulata]
MEIPLNHSTMVNPSSNGVRGVAKIGPCLVHLPVDSNLVLPWQKCSCWPSKTAWHKHNCLRGLKGTPLHVVQPHKPLEEHSTWATISHPSCLISTAPSRPLLPVLRIHLMTMTGCVQ